MLSDTRYLSPKNLILRKTLFTLKFEKFLLFPNKVELLTSRMLSRNYPRCVYDLIFGASDRRVLWHYSDRLSCRKGDRQTFRQFVVGFQI